MSVEQGAFIGSVFLAVFSTALEARVYDRLAGKAARPEYHRFMSINRLQAIMKHVSLSLLFVILFVMCEI